MTRYGPQSCPSTRRGAPGPGGYSVDAPPVEVASPDPVSVSAPTVSRHDAHRPSGASGGSCRPHRGQRRDRRVTVSDITSPGSAEARLAVHPPPLAAEFRASYGGHLDQTEPSRRVTSSTPE
jgi:hypothetical protein